MGMGPKTVRCGRFAAQMDCVWGAAPRPQNVLLHRWNMYIQYITIAEDYEIILPQIKSRSWVILPIWLEMNYILYLIESKK